MARHLTNNRYIFEQAMRQMLRERLFAYRDLFFAFSFVIASLFTVLAVNGEPLHMDDGLRHIAFASQMWEKGAHSWQDYFFAGYFAGRDFDPWFLAHYTYLPFTLLDPVTGLKWLTLAYALTLCVAFCLLLFRLRLPVSQVSFFLIALVWGSTLLNWRILSGRPLIFASALLLLSVWAVLGRRPWWLGIILLVSFLFSHLFVFILAVSLSGAVWLFLRGERMTAGKMLLASALGPTMGAALHPQSGLYLTYLHEVFLVIPWLRSMGLGTEFTPGLIIPDPSILVVIVLTTWTYWGISRSMAWSDLVKSQTFFLGVLALGFGVCWLVWVRAIDFFWPSLLVAAASAWQLRLTLPPFNGPKLLRQFLPVLVLFVAVHWAVRALTSIEPPPAGKLIDYHLDFPAGSRVFNLDWEVFAPLVFHRADVQYARGMDPTFDHIENPKRASLLDQVFSPHQQSAWAVATGLLAGDHSVLYPAENTSLNSEVWLNAILTEYQPDFVVLRKGRHKRLEQDLEICPLLIPLEGTGALRVYRVLDVP